MKIFKLIIVKIIINLTLFCSEFTYQEETTVCTHMLYKNFFTFRRSTNSVIAEVPNNPNYEYNIVKKIKEWMQQSSENKAYICPSKILLPYVSFATNIPWNTMSQIEIQRMDYSNFLNTLKTMGYKIIAKTIAHQATPRDEFILHSAEVSTSQ